MIAAYSEPILPILKRLLFDFDAELLRYSCGIDKGPWQLNYLLKTTETCVCHATYKVLDKLYQGRTIFVTLTKLNKN